MFSGDDDLLMWDAYGPWEFPLVGSLTGHPLAQPIVEDDMRLAAVPPPADDGEEEDNDNSGILSLELKLGQPESTMKLTNVNDQVNGGAPVPLMAPVGGNQPPLLIGHAPVPDAEPAGGDEPPLLEDLPAVGNNAQIDLNRQPKSLTINPPYPWATDRRAVVHSSQYLLSNDITLISGDVECKHCQQPSRTRIEFNLTEKLTQINEYVLSNSIDMKDRAPLRWTHPRLGKCEKCEQENSLKPVLAEKKRNINWLFLLLGEMIGCCTIEQLKFFCKHTNNHRTGAKDRLLYLTYLSLLAQLNQ